MRISNFDHHHRRRLLQRPDPLTSWPPNCFLTVAHPAPFRKTIPTRARDMAFGGRTTALSSATVAAAGPGPEEGSKASSPPSTRYIAKHPFVAGAMTGGIEILITFPFEFIKVQLQLKHHYKLNAFSNPVDCALYTMRTKGPLGLYKGLTPWIVFAFPRSAVRFSTYEHAAQWLMRGDEGKVDPLYAMLAGTLAGSVEFATVGTPMQCIQIKMAHDAYSAAPKFKGFVDAAAGIVREEGLWRGLYAGVGPTVLKGGVNNCIRFSAFNEMKYLYQEYKGPPAAGGGGSNGSDGPALTAAESMLLGGLAGGLSAVATHPIDTVKSNMQALGGGGYTSSWDCLLKIVQTQGVWGLYRGIAPRFVRVCLEIGLHFTLYERISRELDKMW